MIAFLNDSQAMIVLRGRATFRVNAENSLGDLMNILDSRVMFLLCEKYMESGISNTS